MPSLLKNGAKEGDLEVLYLTFLAVKYKVVLAGYLHYFSKLILCCVRFAINA